MRTSESQSTTETKLKRIAWLSSRDKDKQFDCLMHYFNVRCPDFFGHKIGKVKQGFMCYIMNSDSFVTNIVTQTQLVSCNPAMNESAHDYKKHQENNTDLYRHHGNQHIPLPILIRPSDDL